MSRQVSGFLILTVLFLCSCEDPASETSPQAQGVPRGEVVDALQELTILVLKGEAQEPYQRLVRRGKDIAPDLRAVIEDDATDEDVLLWACSLYSDIEGRAALMPLLWSELSEAGAKRAKVVASQVENFAEQGDGVEVPVLLRMIRSEDRDLAECGMGILAKAGDRAMIPGVIEMTRSTDEDIVERGIRGVTALKPDSAGEILVRLLKEGSDVTQRRAAEAVRELGTMEARGVLHEYLADPQKARNHGVFALALSSLRSVESLALMKTRFLQARKPHLAIAFARAINALDRSTTLYLLFMLASDDPQERMLASRGFNNLRGFGYHAYAPEDERYAATGRLLEWWQKRKEELPAQLLPEGLSESLVIERLREVAQKQGVR